MRYYSPIIALVFFLLCANASAIYAQSEEYGIASFYDDSFQGSKTASLEPYDKNKYTGAHKTLPFGTIVKVTRLDTKESVKVRINDRGPYIKGRIIELSRKAAQKIGLDKSMVAKVKLEVLGSGGGPDEYSKPEPKTSSPPIVVGDGNSSRSGGDKLTTVKKTKDTHTGASKKAVDAPKPQKKKQVPPPPSEKKKDKTPEPVAIVSPKETAKRVRGRDFKLFDLYKVQILRPERSGYGVQVASLSNYANVMKQVAELQEKWFNNILISVEKGKNGEPIYKVLLGPFPNKKIAKGYEKQLKKKKKIDGFIVDLSAIKY